MTIAVETIENTIHHTQTRLKQMRRPAGYWEGYVTSSAFTTATAVFSLAMVDRRLYQNLVEGGLQWLKDHQNHDGGWGDTTMSQSRLATTLVCYSAFTVSDGSFTYNDTVSRAEAWIERTVGSLEPNVIVQAVRTAPSKGKWISPAVLMMCALAKRPGSKETAWHYIRPLPITSWTLPQVTRKRSHLAMMGLDVPAFIALELAQRHFSRVSKSVKRGLYFRSRHQQLMLLATLQAKNGAFSESLSLTSVVLLCLAAIGHHDHQMVTKSAQYLVDAVRDDGSWPSEMPLTVRATTQSLLALSAEGTCFTYADKTELTTTRDWLLTLQRPQHRAGTQSVPGGWATNDLPGTRSNAYDTADAMMALSHLDPNGRRTQSAVAHAIHWIMDLKQKDGGFSLFDKDQYSAPSCPAVTAHVLGAIGSWHARLPSRDQQKIHRSLQCAVTFLKDRQLTQGYWIPLWFGNDATPAQTNPVYGTSRVLTHLALLPPAYHQRMCDELIRAAEWLASVQHDNGGWGCDIDITPTIEETALAVNALATVLTDHDLPLFDDQTKSCENAVRLGTAWLMQSTDNGNPFDPKPIGLSFTGQWYGEASYPITFALAALQKAWQTLL